jgi:hypothetical protein
MDTFTPLPMNNPNDKNSVTKPKADGFAFMSFCKDKNGVTKRLLMHTLNISAAKELEHYIGFHGDLEFTTNALKYLYDNYTKLDKVVSQSLWSSACIAYWRCFNNGKRFISSKKLRNKFTLEMRKSHEKLKKIRGDHIAHAERASPFELTQICALIDEDKLLGIGMYQCSFAFPSEEDIYLFYQFVCTIKKLVEREIPNLTNTCLVAIQKQGVKNIRKCASDVLKWPHQNTHFEMLKETKLLKDLEQ